MPPQRPGASAPNDTDTPEEKSEAGLKPVPRGAVYGFMFPFDGTATHPHPGIVIMSKVASRGEVEKVGVIALAITHSEQEMSWKDKKALVVPEKEKEPMGLDAKPQWVCLFEQATFFFPEDIKGIKTAGSAFLGQASEEFALEVLMAWNDYRSS